MNDVDCPYCGQPLMIDHEDGQGYDEDMTHSQQCIWCEKEFIFTTTHIYHYNAEKADCLNEGGEHDWKPTITAPKYFTKMRCSMCHDERGPTQEERIKYNIPLTYENE